MVRESGWSITCRTGCCPASGRCLGRHAHRPCQAAAGGRFLRATPAGRSGKTAARSEKFVSLLRVERRVGAPTNAREQPLTGSSCPGRRQPVPRLLQVRCIRCKQRCLRSRTSQAVAAAPAAACRRRRRPAPLPLSKPPSRSLLQAASWQAPLTSPAFHCCILPSPLGTPPRQQHCSPMTARRQAAMMGGACPPSVWPPTSAMPTLSACCWRQAHRPCSLMAPDRCRSIELPPAAR